MTPTELAEVFNANPTVQEVAKLLYHTIVEANKMAEQLPDNDPRKAEIFKEADQEWRDFTKLCPQVNAEAFKMALHQTLPATKALLP
jgi:membrane carboxypeptidase/penicillin-binding protein PbpC